ncbi:glycosyltransferase family 4 protein [Pseudomonadota bacterium]
MDQANEEFGVEFKWDRDLLSGYKYHFLDNRAKHPGFSSFFGCNTPEIGTIIREEKFDAVLLMGWNLFSYWQAAHACRLSGTPILVRGDSHLGTPRKLLKKTVKSIVYPWMFKRCDGCLYVGKLSREYYMHYGVSVNKLFFSPHSVDNDWLSRECREIDKTSLRREFGIDENTTVVLFAGKLVDRKRPLDIIRALEVLGSDFLAVFVGAGELAGQIKQTARNMGVNCHVLGFKNQSEMPAMYVLADVLVLPSDGSETWGLVVNEAMACGVPVIASDAVGCVPDLIDVGLTGFSYPSADIAALRNRLAEYKASCGKRGFVDSLRAKIDSYSPVAASKGIVFALESVKK